MKKTLKIILTGIIISYLVIGLGLDRYSEYKSSQTDSFWEGVGRDLNQDSPSHLLTILFWPFYL